MEASAGAPRVVHVVEALASGVLNVVANAANASARAGLPTTIVAGRRPESPPAFEPYFDPRVDLVTPEYFGRRHGRKAILGAFNARRALKRIVLTQPTIVHSHSTIAGLIARTGPRRGVTYLHSPHAYAFLNPALPRAIRVCLRLVEQLLAPRALTIAVSESEADVARRLAKRARVRVVKNGVSKLPDPENGPTTGPRRIVAFGRIASQRMPEATVLVVKRVEQSHRIEFVWVGDGPSRAAVESSGYRVTGWLRERDALAEVGRASVVIHLATFEGLPIALLQAMALRKPIVAWDIPPIREVLGDNNLLVTDVDTAAARVQELLLDRDRADRAGRLNAVRAETFDADRASETLVAIYRSNSEPGTS